MADYLNLCKCGGSMSYLETLRYANLSNPFAPGSGTCDGSKTGTDEQSVYETV